MEQTKPVSIFLVEDDAKLAALVKQFLERNHFKVTTEEDGNCAVERILNEQPDMVLLDIMLPGKDGRAICRELRYEYNSPILMLTALGEEIDEIVGLEIGADDYIKKPVRPRLLLSKINAILRFSARSGYDISTKANQDDTLSDVERIVLGNLEIQFPGRDVFKNGRPVRLTTAQFDLFSYLARHAGQTVSRDRLFTLIRGFDYDGFNRSIDLAIARIRKKIGDDGKHPRIIKSIRGKGYLMVKPLGMNP